MPSGNRYTFWVAMAILGFGIGTSSYVAMQTLFVDSPPVSALFAFVVGLAWGHVVDRIHDPDETAAAL